MKRYLFLICFVLSLQSGIGQTPLTTAVDFTAPDIHGNTHNLFSYLDAGKYVVLDFYFTTCPSCQGATPTINQTYIDFGCNTGNVIVIGINTGNTPAQVALYETTYGATYPSIAGTDGGTIITDNYQVGAFPTIILIAPNRDIVEQDIWPVDPLTSVVQGYGGTLSPCPPSLVANFSANLTTINMGQSVNFTDLSTGSPTSWAWAFQGGNPAASTQQNPANIQYSAAGWYNVTLTISNTGGTATETKTQYIRVVDPNVVEADFVGVPTYLVAGNTVQFTNTSTGAPTSFAWSFQSGTPATSTQQNPLITYNTPGTFNVTLTASKTGQTDTETKTGYINVVDPSQAPHADFIANYTIIPAGASINFYNYSTGIYDSLRWFFQDAVTSTSTVSNPTLIQYNNLGNWDVTLILYSQLGNDTLTKVGYIMVVPPGFGDTLTADFQAITGRLIPQGWSVSYEDLSVGYPTSWYWVFEGGTPNSSTVQNPQNITYSTPGIFDVRLIISNGISSDTLFKDNYIVVTTSPWPDPNGYCEDTVTNVISSERPLTFRHLTPNKWGYFPGHNEYQVKAYAEKYTYYTFNRVIGLIVPVVKAYGATTAAKVRFTVWDVDANGKPGAELQIKDVPINNFTPYFYHVVMFNNPAPVNGSFFVGYQLYYNNPADTFVVYMAPNRGVGGNNTVYCKKGAAWLSPSALLNDTLNTSLAIRILGCLYNDMPDIDTENDIVVYPNPADDRITVEINNTHIQYFEALVHDITGRFLSTGLIRDGDNSFTIDVSQLTPGIYFVKMFINHQQVTRKVIVN
jgi:PKD repeat protein